VPTTTSITTPFSKKTTLALPAFYDDEGHTITFIANIPSSAPYITYDSGSNKFIVDPQSGG
jgi:hypothetical protein